MHCAPHATRRGDFGPDVRFINSALQHVFERYKVDAGRCGLAGGAGRPQPHLSTFKVTFKLNFSSDQPWELTSSSTVVQERGLAQCSATSAAAPHSRGISSGAAAMDDAKVCP